MASRVAASGTATGGVAVAVVVGDEELLVERAVARLVAAASVAAGQAGSAGAVGGAHPEGDSVHDVAGGALSPGELTSLTAPSLFGGGSLVVIRDAHHASKDEPQYEIQSNKTDHIAMHKGSALKRSK